MLLCSKAERAAAAAAVYISSAPVYAETSMNYHFVLALSTSTLQFERRVNEHFRDHII